MHIQCPTCGLLVDEEKYDRCPRCHTSINIPVKCGKCNGCSIRGLCSGARTTKQKEN